MRWACDADVADWDDPEVDWAGFGLALLRSTWDYAERLRGIPRLGGGGRRGSPRLLNPLAVVGWNTDKHYLRELARGRRARPCRHSSSSRESAQAWRCRDS